MKPKKLIFLLGIYLFQVSSWAQSDPLEKFIDKYSGKPGFRYVEAETDILGFITGEESEDVEARLMAYRQDSTTNFSIAEITEAFAKRLRTKHYEMLVGFNRKGSRAEFHVRRKGSEITGIAITMLQKERAVFFSATGEFDLKDAGKLKEIIKCELPGLMKQFCRE
jgi:hypothetical protein